MFNASLCIKDLSLFQIVFIDWFPERVFLGQRVHPSHSDRTSH